MKRLTLLSLALFLAPSVNAYEDSYESIAEIIFDDCPACYKPGSSTYTNPESSYSYDKSAEESISEPTEEAAQATPEEIPEQSTAAETPGVIEDEIQAQPLEDNIHGDVEL